MSDSAMSLICQGAMFMCKISRSSDRDVATKWAMRWIGERTNTCSKSLLWIESQTVSRLSFGRREKGSGFLIIKNGRLDCVREFSHECHR